MKVYSKICAVEPQTFDAIGRELRNEPEYPGPEPDGWLLGTLEQVEELMRLSYRSGLAVRFRDGGFDQIVTAWHWLAEGVGIAQMLVVNEMGQIHLMLSGASNEDRAAANVFLKSAGIHSHAVSIPNRSPSLITLERSGYVDDAGGFLLGMILFAPFCEHCGVCDPQK